MKFEEILRLIASTITIGGALIKLSKVIYYKFYKKTEDKIDQSETQRELTKVSAELESTTSKKID
jgi:hypothetical protein